jgi:predicted O-methyltransferase YrrM
MIVASQIGCLESQAWNGDFLVNTQLLEQLDWIAQRTAQQIPLLKKQRGDSFNVLEVAFLKAAYESAEYYEQHLIKTPAFASDLDLLSAAVRVSNPDGLFLEFGVASGRTISHIAKSRSGPVYGFDSFEGLPEDWRSGFSKGAFAGDLPPVPGNVTLIKGWFNQTLPAFLAAHQGDVALLHVDCDLYSSTKCIFDLLAGRLKSGTVIVFDEFWNYPAWRQHEIKAFDEFKAEHQVQAQPVGFVPSHQQVAFVIL